jgi:uncharacterized MAPEG superfamily protein
MDVTAVYGHALVAIALTAILWALLGPVSAIKKEAAGAAPGGEPAADYASPAYRWHRAYMNLTESFAPFAAVTIAAIFAGASPFWVNLLASAFVVLRGVVAIVHIRGIGKPNGGLRSILFTLGWAATIALAILTLLAVF